MQLAASVAVILLAFSVAATDSTETEATLSQKFEQFQQDVQTFVNQVEEKAKEAYQNIQNSEFSNRTRNWFSNSFEKLKAKWEEAFPSRGSD